MRGSPDMEGKQWGLARLKKQEDAGVLSSFLCWKDLRLLVKFKWQHKERPQHGKQWYIVGALTLSYFPFGVTILKFYKALTGLLGRNILNTSIPIGTMDECMYG